MKNLKRIFALLLLFLSVLLFSIVSVTAATVVEQQDINDGSTQIDAKYKKILKYKVTFNANGGKIGTKTKVSFDINSGSKIKKLPTTPKRTGYKFEGWYTQKSGGKKISVNTRPTTTVTYYAQWKRVLNAAEKKLVGTWTCYDSNDSYIFNKKGKFKYTDNLQSKTGDFKVSYGEITFSKITWRAGTTKIYQKYPTTVAEYKVEKSPKMLYLMIKSLTFPDQSKLPLAGYKIYSKTV